MASITLQRLKQLIAEAYAAGYAGALDMSDSYVEEIAEKLMSNTEPTAKKNDGWQVFKADQLRKTPVGTMFEHYTKGKCWIESNRLEQAHMKFHTGEISHFYSDDAPWDEPMRLIGPTMNPVATKRRRYV